MSWSQLFYFVGRLDVCHDHSYFATCSDDGQVKIWECGKLEGKNVANRSKQTLNKQGMSICKIKYCLSENKTTMITDTYECAGEDFGIQCRRLAYYDFLRQEQKWKMLSATIYSPHWNLFNTLNTACFRHGLSIYEIKRICHHAQFFIISALAHFLNKWKNIYILNIKLK